jgi:tetratricopeptide (TPR) repeat protein
MESEDNNLFVAYIEKTLDDSEREAFERRLTQESAFAEEFDEFKDIYVVIENRFSSQRASVLKTLKNADVNFRTNEETKHPEKKIIAFKPWKYGIAASILLAIGLFLFNSFSKPTYSEYASHDIISLTLRGETDEITKNAETAFNAEKYNEAVNYFDQLLKETPENISYQYYKAIALIELNKYEEADNLLQRITKSNSVYATKATWQMALSNLKQKRYDEVKKILTTIPLNAPEYAKAQKLLSDL